jgi:hypothetical protein
MIELSLTSHVQAIDGENQFIFEFPVCTTPSAIPRCGPLLEGIDHAKFWLEKWCDIGFDDPNHLRSCDEIC